MPLTENSVLPVVVKVLPEGSTYVTFTEAPKSGHVLYCEVSQTSGIFKQDLILKVEATLDCPTVPPVTTCVERKNKSIKFLNQSKNV
jgi:hypothetical protein